MDYAKALKKMKKQELAPRAELWSRIEDTLAGRRGEQRWKYKLAFSASTLAVCAMLTFTGVDHYGHYRLEQYLANAFDYPSYVEYFDIGTFI